MNNSSASYLPNFSDNSYLPYSNEDADFNRIPHNSNTLNELPPNNRPASPTSNALAGVYSNTGFDMIQILSKLIHRPNPQIQLGPIDLSCSFVVSDARGYDCPVVYSSPAFERLTGYKNEEIIGKNCRFLQSPDGQVTCGSRRQHTDNQAVYHLKAQLNLSKEHQASIINYRKGGQPFVNLVTVVPTFGDDGQVDYFVGLQVDLVEQPNSILEKMKDGTYLINYHQPMSVPRTIPQRNNKLLLDSSSVMDEYFRELPTNNYHSNSNTSSTKSQPEHNSVVQNADIIGLLDPSQIDFESLSSLNGNNNEQQLLKEWNKVLLDQSCDFVHVLSLKGVFLYASQASKHMLEYEPKELVGNLLSSICHPSDIIPVMREIKETTTNPEKAINLLFRIRRKDSGYIWIDCRGKLHMDQSKGRKCLVLSGRERSVYSLMSHQITPSLSNTIESDLEYWAKLSLAGLYLYVTPTCKEVVGFTSDSLEQESIYQYAENNAITDITKALEIVKDGGIVRVPHTILNAKGTYVRVLSTFYPGDAIHSSGKPSFALLQVKAIPFDQNQDSLPLGIEPDVKNLNEAEGENIFAELSTFKSTNWQYELHQLQQSNKRLREQLDKYINPNKQRRKKKSKSSDLPKMCAKCQRKDSPEWRKGPNGPKELCNACGLRYAKSLSAQGKK
uniref:White collar 1c n=1 Tax=Blakeslea trispora TaxID=4850 RepID=A0A3G1Z332_BLATR|nr:white collar 1c [Blakeslea trispora]